MYQIEDEEREKIVDLIEQYGFETIIGGFGLNEVDVLSLLDELKFISLDDLQDGME